MRIYFSGGGGLRDTPEVLIPQLGPHIMLTYHQLHEEEKSSTNRMSKHLNPEGFEPDIVANSKSLFVDSGAHSLYNIHVLKHGKREGKHGKKLDKPPVRWGDPYSDWSHYDLTKGSDFRKYCNAYAKYIAAHKGTKVLFATVDAISNPDLTWEIQRFFEEERGVKPVPIIHYNTPMKYVDRYVESGRYKLLGVGGLGQGVSQHEYGRWATEFFKHICPASNSYNPVIRTHGFAMTSHRLMTTYPWWSVDSATWVKLSAYGWLYIPRWSQGQNNWDFDSPPLMINFSERLQKDGKASPRMMERGKHFTNLNGKEEGKVRNDCLKWLKGIGLELGSLDRKGEVKEFGVSSHHRARSIANLTYLKRLEASRPKWPHPLELGHSKINHGFNLDTTINKK